MARDPQLKIHMYGKDVKPGRKVGHVNTYGDDLDDVPERARHARRLPERDDHRMSQASPVSPVAGIVMGSDSDWPVMEAAAQGASTSSRSPTRSTSSPRTACRTR